MPVKVLAHRCLDLGERPGREPSPHPENGRLGDTQQQQQEATQPHPRRITVTDRTIHQPLQHQRHGETKARSNDRQQRSRGQPHPHRPDIRPQANQGTLAAKQCGRTAKTGIQGQQKTVAHPRT
jgi:hypothetical protein